MPTEHADQGYVPIAERWRRWATVRTRSDATPTWMWAHFKWIKVTALLTGAISLLWALFRWVVTDSQLTLEYLEVLAWPAVVAAGLFWLREPAREKFRELLKLRAMGVSIDFDRAAHRLSAGIRPDIDAIVAPDGAEESDQDGQVEAARNRTAPDSKADPETVVTLPATTPSSSEKTMSVSPADAVEDGREFLIDVARAGGLSVGDRYVIGTSPLPDARAHLIATLRRVSDRERGRAERSRASLESIIQKSAAWGYELGKSGSPQMVPEVEWGEDGEWSIITEVPSRTRQPAPSTSYNELTPRQRHIKELTDEIRAIEKNDPNLHIKRSMDLDLPEDAYVQLLKDRLSELDPGNPYAR